METTTTSATTPWQFFTSHPEPELGAATATGRIDEFARMGWDPDVVPDPQDPGTFERSKLDWNEVADAEHRRLLDLYRDLIRLRREHPDLTNPDMDRAVCTFDDDAGWFVVRRGAVSVAVNFAAGPQVVPGAGELLLATDHAAAVEASGIRLPGHSAVIVRS
ncbi:MAG: DUF3459 domain-containing protein [Ilumatobacteraceae bacterium]